MAGFGIATFSDHVTTPEGSVSASILDVDINSLKKVFEYCLVADILGTMLSNKMANELIGSIDSVWQQCICQDYIDIDNPVLSDRKTSCSTFRESWLSWRNDFIKYKNVKKVMTSWKVFETWASENSPAVYESLREGATEKDLVETEEELGQSLPASLRLLYRIHNGQDLILDKIRDAQKGLGEFPQRQVTREQIDASMVHGMFGGYQFYDKLVSTRLLTLDQLVFYTKHGFSSEIKIMEEHPDMVIFATSFDLQKRFYVKCKTGNIYVSLRTITDGVLPAAPLGEPLDSVFTERGGRCRHVLDNQKDAEPNCEGNFANWFHEYCHRLETGVYKLDCIQTLSQPTRTSLAISLFPQTFAHGATEQVTKGVRIHVSPVFCPEMCSSSQIGAGPFPAFFWVYSVTMELLKDHTSRPRSMIECQLTHRYWRIEESDGSVEEVRGDAVVGLYPHLRTHPPEGELPFSYQSCTSLEGIPGKMGGHFVFVPGTMDSPQGEAFEAIIKDFALTEPKYIF
mmetsp:Transcript_12906/g.16977  ORF Transcript_12906/g.16977 Transcript_12906/m.16977 type:complete len:512 (-) Transcript_12906:233-1768(-)